MPFIQEVVISLLKVYERLLLATVIWWHSSRIAFYFAKWSA